MAIGLEPPKKRRAELQSRARRRRRLAGDHLTRQLDVLKTMFEQKKDDDYYANFDYVTQRALFTMKNRRPSEFGDTASTRRRRCSRRCSRSRACRRDRLDGVRVKLSSRARASGSGTGGTTALTVPPTPRSLANARDDNVTSRTSPKHVQAMRSVSFSGL